MGYSRLFSFLIMWTLLGSLFLCRLFWFYQEYMFLVWNLLGSLRVYSFLYWLFWVLKGIFYSCVDSSGFSFKGLYSWGFFWVLFFHLFLCGFTYKLFFKELYYGLYFEGIFILVWFLYCGFYFNSCLSNLKIVFCLPLRSVMNCPTSKKSNKECLNQFGWEKKK